ncbi:hypothetical protein AAVH_21802 [Aphelenchoides avenae]|nr:hypothetical protein AAVH_21802 [Aphelenchus avenae]
MLLTELPDYKNSLVIVALQSYVTKYEVDLVKKCLEDGVPALFVRSQCDRYLYDMLAEGDIDEVNQASADKFVAVFKENMRKQLHAADSRLLGYPLFLVSSKSLRNSVAEEAPSSGVYFEDKKFLDFVASWMWSDEVGREADLD